MYITSNDHSFSQKATSTDENKHAQTSYIRHLRIAGTKIENEAI